MEAMVALLQEVPDDAAVAGVHGGRGGARRVVLADGDVVYLRKCLRGGLVRHLVRDIYLRTLGPPRPLRELLATETARAAGCRAPTVRAACVEKAGPFYRGWVITCAVRFWMAAGSIAPLR